MTTKREGFFGTDNLHRAGWAALVGLAGFSGGLIFQKVNGPQKVVVDSQPSPQNGPITTEISPRSKEIADLANAIQKLAQANASETEKNRLRELKAEVDRLRTEVAQAKRSSAAPTHTDPQSSAQTGNIRSTPTDLATDKFRLPDTARGYTSAKIYGVAAPTCPPSEILKGSTLTIRFILTDLSLMSAASPIRVTVDKIRFQANLLQITELWAKLQVGENMVSLTPNLEAGNYRITYGFYRRDQLSGEFPPLYSKECEFQVT